MNEISCENRKSRTKTFPRLINTIKRLTALQCQGRLLVIWLRLPERDERKFIIMRCVSLSKTIKHACLYCPRQEEATQKRMEIGKSIALLMRKAFSCQSRNGERKLLIMTNKRNRKFVRGKSAFPRPVNPRYESVEKTVSRLSYRSRKVNVVCRSSKTLPHTIRDEAESKSRCMTTGTLISINQ
jgi:TFIIF-interacting CTD phosphatase-like protein